MKKIFTLLFTGILLSCVLPAMAQKPGKMFSAGFGIEGGWPVGDLKNSYGGYGGVTARFALRAGPGFATFTTGGILFAPKDVYNDYVKIAVQVPFKAGYKYIFLRHLFVMGELGYSSYITYYNDGDSYEDDIKHSSTGGFTFAPTVGAQWGVFEVGLRYESTHVDGGNASYVGVRAGFNF